MKRLEEGDIQFEEVKERNEVTEMYQEYLKMKNREQNGLVENEESSFEDVESSISDEDEDSSSDEDEEDIHIEDMIERRSNDSSIENPIVRREYEEPSVVPGEVKKVFLKELSSEDASITSSDEKLTLDEFIKKHEKQTDDSSEGWETMSEEETSKEEIIAEDVKVIHFEKTESESEDDSDASSGSFHHLYKPRILPSLDGMETIDSNDPKITKAYMDEDECNLYTQRFHDVHFDKFTESFEEMKISEEDQERIKKAVRKISFQEAYDFRDHIFERYYDESCNEGDEVFYHYKFKVYYVYYGFLKPNHLKLDEE